MKATYEIKRDTTMHGAGKLFFIRECYPSTFITDSVSKREINKTAKALRQLGHVVTDTTKP